MAQSNKFETISAGFNSLQSQLEQQFVQSQQLQKEIDLLSANKSETNDHIINNDKKSQPATPFFATNMVPNYFTNNIMQSITSKNKFTDVKFEVYTNNNDKREFYGIRALFAMHSKVFEDLLYKNNSQTQTIIVKDKNIPPFVFEVLIHLFYGLTNMKTLICNKNVINVLYASNKYNIVALKNYCFDFLIHNEILINNKNMDIKILNDILNKIIEMNAMNDIFTELICKILSLFNLDTNKLLLLNNSYLLKHLSFNSFSYLLFESDLSQEFKWDLCIQFSRYKKGTNFLLLMQKFKHKIDFTLMSAQYFVSKVQNLNILNENELINIMHTLLHDMDKKEENKIDTLSEYNRQYSKVIIYNKTTQIITNGNGNCEWIWFASNNGWTKGKHIFNVKCNGLSIRHSSGNIVAMIGASNYKLIKNKDIWNLNECIYDIDFDEKEEEGDEGDEENEEGEIVSMSYDWNGYLYKNNSMIINTENGWSLNDKVTIVIDIDNKDLKFLKNGKSITHIQIVPSDNLIWFPVLQCCACKGHHYTVNFE